MGNASVFQSLVGTLSNILAMISLLIWKKQPFCYKFRPSDDHFLVIKKAVFCYNRDHK